jgi:hypothetical protein
MSSRLLPFVLLAAGCTSLEGLTPNRDFGAERFDDDQRWSSPGRTFSLAIAQATEEDDGGWLIDADFSAWCATSDCRDVDEDGLDDDWEDAAIDALRPAMQFHPDEPMFDDLASGVVTVARVAPADGCYDELRVVLAFLYDEDPGRCSIARHHGDVERMAFTLVATGRANQYRVEAIYTAAHEGTALDGSLTESGYYMKEFASLKDRFTGQPRPVVLVAAGKHATYPANGSFVSCQSDTWTCVYDVCQMEVVDPVVVRAVNVGEPHAPRPSPTGIDAWADRPFCGAEPLPTLTAACAPPVRDKLIGDPIACVARPTHYDGATNPFDFLNPRR